MARNERQLAAVALETVGLFDDGLRLELLDDMAIWLRLKWLTKASGDWDFTRAEFDLPHGYFVHHRSPQVQTGLTNAKVFGWLKQMPDAMVTLTAEGLAELLRFPLAHPPAVRQEAQRVLSTYGTPAWHQTFIELGADYACARVREAAKPKLAAASA